MEHLAAAFFTFLAVVSLIPVLNRLSYLYRIKKGKEDLMDFLKVLGENWDEAWPDGQLHSRDVIKKHTAKVAAWYFKQVRDKERK